MSEEKKYKNFTAADIERYHKGLLSPDEMHEVEKAALDDPFLADALEGYGGASTNAAADLSELEKKLQQRISGSKEISIAPIRNSFKWWKVAAAVVLVGGLGFLTFRLSTSTNNKSIATSDEKKSNPAGVAPVVDSTRSTTKKIDIVSTKISADKAAVRKEKKSGEGNASHIMPDSSDIAISTPSPKGNNDVRVNDSIKILNEEVAKAEVRRSRKSEEKSKTLAPQASVNDKNAIVSNNYKKAEPNAAAVLNENYKTSQAAADGSGITPMNYFRGRVVDANNNPLAFANITNVRDNVGTYADSKGNFTLISPDSVLNVQIKSLGFENNLAQLRTNVASNQIIMRDEKTAPDKILSYRKADAIPLQMDTRKLEEPEPADGWINYNTYMANNVNVSGDLKMKHNTGQVQVSFDVNENGEPVNIKIERSLCQKCDEEAVRLIREGPKWKKKNKKNKHVTVTVPFDTNH